MYINDLSQHQFSRS